MLPERIKKMEQKNRIARSVVLMIRWMWIKIVACAEAFRIFLRRLGFFSTQLESIQKYKNMYQGKRCFIVCTGPSLTINDLELLNNEYTFGMNSICLAFEKTNWRPSFFGIQDCKVYEKLKDTLETQIKCPMFVSNTIEKKYVIPKEWNVYMLNTAYHTFEQLFQHRYFAKFSKNCSVVVYDGYSITYSLMELAVYMGFSEIYLIGADCNYIGERQHFIEHGHFDPNAALASNRLKVSYSVAKRYCDAHGVRIYNATRGGALEVFPRKKLEDVLEITSDVK